MIQATLFSITGTTPVRKPVVSDEVMTLAQQVRLPSGGKEVLKLQRIFSQATPAEREQLALSLNTARAVADGKQPNLFRIRPRTFRTAFTHILKQYEA